MVWLLHLVPLAVADAAVAEAARVLRPGGCLVTTVDKDLAHGHPAPKVGGDARAHVDDLTRRLGLDAAGTATFSGTTGWDAGAPEARAMFTLAAFRRP